jgi:hypothetical protein
MLIRLLFGRLVTALYSRYTEALRGHPVEIKLNSTFARRVSRANVQVYVRTYTYVYVPT